MTSTPHDEPLPDFNRLTGLLLRIPAIRGSKRDHPPRITTGRKDRWWYVEFPIAVRHPLASETVQWLAWILNDFCLADPLPTNFKPYSSCPYLNGPPKHTLTWSIDCAVDAMSPGEVAGYLESNLPSPLGRRAEWKIPEFPEEWNRPPPSGGTTPDPP